MIGVYLTESSFFLYLFCSWNMGYEAWEHWGEVLYHADSIYNVNGVRMTLGEYQMSQNVSLKKMDIQWAASIT